MDDPLALLPKHFETNCQKKTTLNFSNEDKNKKIDRLKL